jgi:hypothetical protein
MADRHVRKVHAVAAVSLLLAAGFSGGMVTYGAFSTTESASGTIGAAGNFPQDSSDTGEHDDEEEESADGKLDEKESEEKESEEKESEEKESEAEESEAKDTEEKESESD